MPPQFSRKKTIITTTKANGRRSSTSSTTTKKALSKKLPNYTPPSSTMGISLTAKQFTLFDVAFKRRYLVEWQPKEVDLKYHLAQLMWVKLSHLKSPWWPAMISIHPQRDVFYRYQSSLFFSFF